MLSFHSNQTLTKVVLVSAPGFICGCDGRIVIFHCKTCMKILPQWTIQTTGRKSNTFFLFFILLSLHRWASAGFGHHPAWPFSHSSLPPWLLLSTCLHWPHTGDRMQNITDARQVLYYWATWNHWKDKEASERLWRMLSSAEPCGEIAHMQS